MTWPTNKWLSIVFALILVTELTEIGATTSSTNDDHSYQQTTGGGNAGNYDVIDVAKQSQPQLQPKSNEGLNKMLTGQTTRIILTGEVDDDFWLKHLGEDFHHAVHLMVGGRNDPQNPYRGQHTMNAGLYNVNPDSERRQGARIYTKPEYRATAMNVKPEASLGSYGTIQRMADSNSQSDFQGTDNKPEQKQSYEMPEHTNETPKENPVERLENVDNLAPAESVAYTTESTDAAESPNLNSMNETHSQPSGEIEPNNVQNTPLQEVGTDSAVTNRPYEEEKSYENMFALGEKLANTFYNPNSFNIPDEKLHKNLHYTDSLQKYSTHTKYNDHSEHTDHTDHKHTHTEHKHSHTDHKHSHAEQNPTPTTTPTVSDDREYSGDGDILDENNFPSSPHQKPVVISLPETSKTMVQQLSDSVTPVVVKVPPVIYHEKAKKYYRPNKKQQSSLTPPSSTATQSTQHNTLQQALSYPLSQIYNSYYSPTQSQQHQQHQQQQHLQQQLPQQQQQQLPQLYPEYQNSYYNPITADSYDPSTYTGHSIYPPTSQLPGEQTVESIPGLGYILGKTSDPAVSSYPDMHKQLQANADPNLYNGYTRVGRSYQKFFYDGL